MELFHDLQNNGQVYALLHEHGLVRKPFEEEVVKNLIDQMWYPEIDYDQDQSSYDQMSALPIYLIHLDEHKTDAINSVVNAYKALVSIKESGHLFDFLLVDCRSDTVAGFGLGRKNRAFSAISENGSEFTQDNSEAITRLSSTMPSDLYTKLNTVLTELGQDLSNIDNTPGNEEILQELLDDGPTDDGYYFYEDDDLELNEEEIQDYINDLGIWAENVDDAQYDLRLIFPNLEIYELNTGDY